MDQEKRHSNCWIAYVVGIIFGIVVASLWVAGCIPGIECMIPYAVADALLIFGLTAIIAIIARALNSKCFCNICLRPYIITTIIMASIFLIFAQIFVGTVLTFTLQIILSFIGAISFCTMLVTFVALIIKFVSRR